MNPRASPMPVGRLAGTWLAVVPVPILVRGVSPRRLGTSGRSTEGRRAFALAEPEDA